jgi:hypothetical protein
VAKKSVVGIMPRAGGPSSCWITWPLASVTLTEVLNCWSIGWVLCHRSVTCKSSPGAAALRAQPVNASGGKSAGVGMVLDEAKIEQREVVKY